MKSLWSIIKARYVLIKFEQTYWQCFNNSLTDLKSIHEILYTIPVKSSKRFILINLFKFYNHACVIQSRQTPRLKIQLCYTWNNSLAKLSPYVVPLKLNMCVVAFCCSHQESWGSNLTLISLWLSTNMLPGSKSSLVTPGTSIILNVVNNFAKTIFIWAMANLIPMQTLGPAPNGW